MGAFSTRGRNASLMILLLLTRARKNFTVRSQTVGCRCEFPDENFYGLSLWRRRNLLGTSEIVEIDPSLGWQVVDNRTVLPRTHPACHDIVYLCPGDPVLFPTWDHSCQLESSGTPQPKRRMKNIKNKVGPLPSQVTEAKDKKMMSRPMGTTSNIFEKATDPPLGGDITKRRMKERTKVSSTNRPSVFPIASSTVPANIQKSNKKRHKKDKQSDNALDQSAAFTIARQTISPTSSQTSQISSEATSRQGAKRREMKIKSHVVSKRDLKRGKDSKRSKISTTRPPKSTLVETKTEAINKDANTPASVLFSEAAATDSPKSSQKSKRKMAAKSGKSTVILPASNPLCRGSRLPTSSPFANLIASDTPTTPAPTAVNAQQIVSDAPALKHSSHPSSILQGAGETGPTNDRRPTVTTSRPAAPSTSIATTIPITAPVPIKTRHPNELPIKTRHPTVHPIKTRHPLAHVATTPHPAASVAKTHHPTQTWSPTVTWSPTQTWWPTRSPSPTSRSR